MDKIISKKCIYIIFLVYLLFICFKMNNFFSKNEFIKVALCTMGKKENLYSREFMDYYIKLGVDHLFIYDNNEPFTEKIEATLDRKYKEKITFLETKNLNINHQSEAFTNCYQNNYKNFNWFIMVDMDEYLYLVDNSLKNYLKDKKLSKCDFIKVHWANSQDNNFLYYEPKSLFERFKKPYIKSKYVKSIIRGNISNLLYWVHSPYFSPIKNVSCTNEGNIINSKNINIESIKQINMNKAYLIHFRFKSTEEFINKYKRGYGNWYSNKTKIALLERLTTYFEENKITHEKIDYIEKELKLNLSIYREKLKINSTYNNKHQLILN